MLSGERSEPHTYVFHRDCGVSIDICLEEIHGPGATYEGVTRGQGFGAEMSMMA